jgi:hypothetical protein
MPRRKSEKTVLEEARARFKLAEEAERENRKEAKIDLEFAAGQQWSKDDQDRRNQSGAGKRPCLVFNKLTGPLNMVSNEARQNQPGLEVHPVDMSGDTDTAEVYEGLIRHIEYVSKADEVYETALEQATRGGFGVFKVTKHHCGGKTFDMELKIERIPNQFSVYVDPFAKRADRSDMNWCFETELIPKAEYKAKYHQSEVVQLNFYEGLINPTDGWVTDEGVRVAHYWHVDIEQRKLLGIQWPDGRVTAEYEDELPDTLPDGLQYAADADGKALERDEEVRRVFCTTTNGVEVLDETEWEGQWIPYLFVPGEELFIGEKRYLFSLIRFARDPQKLYNFYRSSEAETVMLGTKAPWVGVKGAFRDPRWASANSMPWAYLEYEPVDIAGSPAPPPSRNIAEPPIQALSVGAAQAADDIKSTTNVFDAALGARSNETSGVAIQRRQNQSGVANFHFTDNLHRAIQHCGEILCDLIPKIYDMPRQVRVLGEDKKQQIVLVNQKYQDEKGVDRNYDLSAGKYDVTISVGPSYTTQRQEAFETLTNFAQAYPQLLQVAGDLIFQYSDMPGAEKIAERLQKMLPPQLQEQPEGQPQIPPEMQAQIQQMAGENAQLKQLVQTQAQEIATKKVETDSREAIELAKIEQADREAALTASLKNRELDIKTAEISEKLTSVESIALLRGELDYIKMQIANMATGAAAEQAAEQMAVRQAFEPPEAQAQGAGPAQEEPAAPAV